MLLSTSSAVVAERVRARLRAERTDPSVHPEQARRVAQSEIRRHNDRALVQGTELIEDEAACVRDVLAGVSGYGPLQPLLDAEDVEEIWLNGPSAVFVARQGRSERVPVRLTDAELRDVVERMLHSTGRRVDVGQPFVDASLPDGSRLHVAIADVVRGGWAVNIRKFLPRYRGLNALVDGGMLSDEDAALLSRAVRSGGTVIVSGPTHAGKTTLLGALIAECKHQRVVTVEETFELGVDLPDVVALQGRQAGLEGTGEVTLRRLVKEALRMRPDRIVIGEVRGEEALDLLLALNTGIPGAATVHANSAADAVEKLALLPLLAGRNIDRAFVAPALVSAVDLVVHCARDGSGRRTVAEIVEPVGVDPDGRIRTRVVGPAVAT